MKFEHAFHLIRDKLLAKGMEESDKFGVLVALKHPTELQQEAAKRHKRDSEDFFTALNKLTRIWNDGEFDYLPEDEFCPVSEVSDE